MVFSVSFILNYLEKQSKIKNVKKLKIKSKQVNVIPYLKPKKNERRSVETTKMNKDDETITMDSIKSIDNEKIELLNIV